MFSIFEPTEIVEKVYMENSATCEIKGQGKVVLKMTSRKELTLTMFFYVPKIRKNLVFGSLLNVMNFDWCLSQINLFCQIVECMSEKGI